MATRPPRTTIGCRAQKSWASNTGGAGRRFQLASGAGTALRQADGGGAQRRDRDAEHQQAHPHDEHATDRAKVGFAVVRQVRVLARSTALARANVEGWGLP